MAARRDLPDLPALVRRRRRRRGRRPGRDHGPPRPPRGARRRGDLAVAVLHLADGRLRLRRLGLLRRRSGVRHAGGLRRAGGGLPRARHPRRDRLGPEPHVGPPPVVRARRARAATTRRRDWYVWRDPAPGGGPPNDWRLPVPRVRQRVDARRAHGPVLPALVHARAARPQLGEPGRRGRDARHAALLARSRGRRLPARRDPQDRQGPAAARPQPARRGATTRTGTRSTGTCAASAASWTRTRTG